MTDGKTANTVDQDINMLKTAVLYGDRIDLTSPVAGLWNRYQLSLDPDNFEFDFKKEVLERYCENISLGDSFPSPHKEVIENLLHVMRSAMSDDPSFRSVNDRLNSDARMHLVWRIVSAELMAQTVRDRDAIAKIAMNDSAMQRLVADDRVRLRDPLEAGSELGEDTFRIRDFEVGEGIDVNNDDIKYLMDAMKSTWKLVHHTLSSTETYPMFDGMTSAFAGLFGGDVPLPASGRRGVVPLAGKIFARLEDFEKASLDEIIDIRKELDKEVKRFQNAISTTSASLTDTAKGDFEMTLDNLYRKEVVPSIQELEDRIRGNYYLRQLRRSVYSKSSIALGSSGGLAMAVTRHPLELISATGMASGAASAIFQSAGQFLQEREKIKEHKFYFIYPLKKKLDTGSKKHIRRFWKFR